MNIPLKTKVGRWRMKWCPHCHQLHPRVYFTNHFCKTCGNSDLVEVAEDMTVEVPEWYEGD